VKETSNGALHISTPPFLLQQQKKKNENPESG